MASILKGAPVVAAMNERNAALCAQLKTKGIVPTLAVVRVGAREDDLSYERGVMTRCGKVGVEVKQYLLPADAAQDDLLKVIAEINADDAIHGCLLFRPLPKQFDDRTVRAALAPEKDIDGITDGSLAGVFTNTEVVTVPTPPGTGVIASTTGSASAKRTSPHSLPSSFRWMPTSTTVWPGRRQSAPTAPIRPMATTTTSASWQIWGRSWVRELQMVTVAFSRSSIMAAGLPTTRLRPTTTARLPERGTL